MEKNIRQLDEIIWQLDLRVDNETEFIAPYLIKAQNDYIIVDVGPTCGIPELIRQLNILNVTPSNLKYVFLTHIHLDHSGGLGTFLKSFPETQVVVHRRGTPHLVDPEKVLWQSSLDTLGWVAEMYQKPLPVEEERIISIHEKTFNIKVNDLEFNWIETPGHASHHFSFLLENKNIMFCGDSVGMLIPSLNFAMVPTTPHPYRMESGIESINLMIEKKPEKLAFAHHAIRPDAMNLLKKHIAQLQQWKNCVEDCLKKNIKTEEDIGVEISKLDEESARLINGPEEFGGLRKALIGSITGFINLVLKEKTEAEG
ncbi:MBL fold metallo-hydrolase [bacterium]|nr:MBL fold metallo-hydrolase [bacterium]|tara:strand:- start:12533 stop:13471 length:939 start_codon:yes stop_codon:yes gene_type:complete